MRILFVGDVVGTVGRRVLAEQLEHVLARTKTDLCIVNGENVAGGKGMTHNLVKKLRRYGVQIITGGNHSFANSDAFGDLQTDPLVLRPLNFPPGNIGRGSTVYTFHTVRIGVINLLGRTYLSEQCDCPFRTGLAEVERLAPHTSVIIVDFHAEATSEKKALFYHLDGKVSAVLGTHTHVQTADEIISRHGTAFISDVGMTGPEDSCIGMKPRQVVQRFLRQTPVRFEPSSSGPMLNAVVIEIDTETGQATSIERLYERFELA